MSWKTLESSVELRRTAVSWQLAVDSSLQATSFQISQGGDGAMAKMPAFGVRDLGSIPQQCVHEQDT